MYYEEDEEVEEIKKDEYDFSELYGVDDDDDNVGKEVSSYQEVGKRIFYDKRNGEVLAIVGERSGHVRPTTVEEDIESFPTLQERNVDTFAHIDLEYGQFAQDFAEGELVSVDTETKELKFVYHEDETQTPRKPLSKEVEVLKSTNDHLGSMIVQAQLKDMQKDGVIKELGNTVAGLYLQVMQLSNNVKGGE